ncbi:hypothetical protein EV189_3997 [Motilibacter rhizosphaerae]|uniref:Uncharacterized protein n=1 Tax=Motilibacter rhizosphaerae TaxID=598652 RepID=A0A4Q7N7H2_9ACTN|nr:hypothetical protein [Motilibacter rhizosphaerae]RZS77562.1 hypothetical protein EV189_3997 [Motilibacter rhizosphaerae]
MSRRWAAPLAAAAAVTVLAASAGAVTLGRHEAAATPAAARLPAATSTAGLRGTTPRPQSWTSVRTDPDPRVLVVGYMGGPVSPGCYGPVTARTTESRGAVTIALVTHVAPAPAPTHDAHGHVIHYGCAAVGVPGHLAVHLSSPLGHRTVIDPAGEPGAGRPARHVPFDGSHLLTPTALPRRYVLTREDGWVDPTTHVSSWMRTWRAPVATVTPSPLPAVSDEPSPGASVPAQDTCPTDAPPDVWLAQYAGRVGSPWHGWTVAGHVAVRGTTATLYAGHDGIAQVGLAWTEPGTRQVVALSSSATCAGSEALSSRALVELARSLAEVRTRAEG